MAAEILQLANLISNAAATLVKTAEADNLPLPNLNDPGFDFTSEAFRANPVSRDAANVIVAAAAQLAAAVAPPPMSIFNMVAGHFRSAAVRTCIELNVTEILREAGPQGLHIDDIAAKAGVDAMKLGRLMRLICNHHIYREITPDVFANTRISGILDTGKSVKEIQERPEDKHEGTPGFVALVEHFIGDGQKGSAFILEHLKDPKTANSFEPNQAPFHRVFDIDVPLWEWYELPEQSYRRRRFGVAMHGIGQMQPKELMLNALDWNALPEGAKVVDVGGGVGTSSLLLARSFPKPKFIVQDFPEVTAQAKKLWSADFPEAVDSGRVDFQPHDFFTAQPVKDASVFVIKQILHDWSDPYSARILTELRKVATNETKLLVVDNIVAPVCHDPTFEGKDIPGASIKDAPAPLLPNFGAANEMNYTIDLAMMVWLNAQERTIGHLSTLLESTGWRIVQCSRSDPPSNFYEPVVAAPIPGFRF